MRDRGGLELEIKDKMTDALLEYAGACHVENMAGFMDEADEDNEEGGGEGKIVIPSSLDERMTQFIHDYEAGERRRSTGRKIRKGLTRAAVILLIIGGSLGVLTTVSQAARVKIFNFIIDTKEKFTQINFQEQGGGNDASATTSGIPADWKGAYVPTYVPEGFKVVKAENEGLRRTLYYTNDREETIRFKQYPVEDSTMQVDTENAQVKSVWINGFKGLLIKKNERFSLLWNNNEIGFYLITELDENEIIKMAENINIIH